MVPLVRRQERHRVRKDSLPLEEETAIELAENTNQVLVNNSQYKHLQSQQLKVLAVTRWQHW